MATGSLSTVAKRSRMFADFCCTSCKDQNHEISADTYCETCLSFYCKNCVYHHNKIHTKHITYGREDIRKWPVSEEVEDFVRKCEVHKDFTLTQFCHDHTQLCCSNCVVTNHSQCNKVNNITELSKTLSTDLQELSVRLETLMEEIKSLLSRHKASVQSLNRTYREHMDFVIERISVNINTTLDEHENSNVSTSDTNEQYIKEEMCLSVLNIVNKFDNSTGKVLDEMKDEVISINSSITNSIPNCTRLLNTLTQVSECIQTIGDCKELCFITSMKCKYIIQQAFTVLGKSDQRLTLQGEFNRNVSIRSDSQTSGISGMCVLPDGLILIADSVTKTVRLLNQQYEVVSHCDVISCPGVICQITPSKAAVALIGHTVWVQFITVTERQIVPSRTFQLEHTCTGIAHHQGDLFISSGFELYKYALSGRQMCRLYEDPLGELTDKCAVSPSGDKLYIISCSKNTLLTLARDGNTLAKYTDQELLHPLDLHVTPAGQVLVCGWRSQTILQVDCKGERKLATFAQNVWDAWGPQAVCYSSTASCIIVAQGVFNILVYRVK
ncbi:uncharacterized protein LOC127843661 isoform X2 [Dreissena polymorpha]|uniref:uncharacterized protein LOC127843661 isoform X2 n=1 Tax=Dreissena polymorpha TaxID=45954 RepID=UPI002264F624|nr:uncharacterized protein LOC127843661 isoform X2 [Dreissena polymorpha]